MPRDFPRSNFRPTNAAVKVPLCGRCFCSYPISRACALGGIRPVTQGERPTRKTRKREMREVLKGHSPLPLPHGVVCTEGGWGGFCGVGEAGGGAGMAAVFLRNHGAKSFGTEPTFSSLVALLNVCGEFLLLAGANLFLCAEVRSIHKLYGHMSVLMSWKSLCCS